LEDHTVRIFCVLAILVFLAGVSANLYAQTPEYYNFASGAESNNSYPFGQTSGKAVNWLFLPGAINQPSPLPATNISAVYFRMGTTGSRTYTNLTIKMAQTDLTNLTSGQFYPGPWTTVYYRASITLTSPGAELWLGPLALDAPFAYDPTRSLVLWVEQAGAPGGGEMRIRQHHISGIKRTWSVGGPPFTPYNSGDNYNCDFGVDTVSGIQLNPPTLTSPANGSVDQPTNVSLQWQDTNSATKAQENGYRMRWRVQGAGTYNTQDLSADSTSFVPGPLAYLSTYEWNVMALGNGTTTLDSDWANGGADWTFRTVPEAAEAQTQPADLVTSTSARLNGWGDPQGVVGNARFGFHEAGTASIFFTPIQAIGPAAEDYSYAIGGLTPGTTYEFMAMVSNTGGSDTGDPLIFTTPVADLRAAAGSHRTICQGEQTVLGAYPPAHGGTPPYQYNWTSNPAGFTSSAPHPAVTPSVDTAYTLTVTDATLVAAQSTVWVYVLDYLATPTLLTPADGSTLPDLEIQLSWSDVADETGYVLHIADGLGHFWNIDVPADQDTWLIDQSAGILSRGCTYRWWVEALGDGSQCNSQPQGSFSFSVEGLPEPVTQAFIYAAKGLHKAGLGSCRTNLGLTSIDSADLFATLNLRNSNGRLLDSVDLAVGYNTFAAYADILERFPSAYLEGTIDIQSPDRLFMVGGLVDNTTNDPSMYPKESEAGPHIFTPLVLRNTDWTSQVVLRNLSDQVLTVELTNHIPDSDDVSAQRTIELQGNGYFKADDIMRFMGDALPYAMLTAQVVQGTGNITGCTRQVSISHTGGIYPFYRLDSGVHGAVLPYLSDTPEYRGSMGLCNTSGQEITIIAQLVAGGSIIDQQDHAVAPMSYLAVADVAAKFRADKLSTYTEGYMRLSSSATFHAIGGIIDKQTSDPSVYGMQQSFAAAFTPLVIRTSEWQSCLVLANDGQNPVSVDLTLYTDGQPLGTVPLTVPGMSVLRLDDVMGLFATDADFGTLFIEPDTPIYGVVMQQTTQGTGGVYPLFTLD